MSIQSPVEITRDDGQYTAIDTETGTVGSGKTRAMALVALGAALGGAVGFETKESAEDVDSKEELRELSEQTQKRFDEEGVTEEDVEDAIEWARS
jgi:hypothetical protein